jgi:hypothetical protein
LIYTPTSVLSDFVDIRFIHLPAAFSVTRSPLAIERSVNKFYFVYFFQREGLILCSGCWPVDVVFEAERWTRVKTRQHLRRRRTSDTTRVFTEKE